MKNLLLLVWCSFPLFLFSQSNSKLELLGSIDLSYRNFGNSGLVQSVRSEEIPKLNFHFDITYNQRLKEKIWLKIGLGFASMGSKSKKKELIGGLDSQGNFDPFLLTGEFFQSKYSYHFLEIPIAFRYEFSQKKIKPFIEVGLVTKYYLQSMGKFFKNENQIDKFIRREEKVKPIQFAPTLSFGLSYEISEKWELVLQPNSTYHLTQTFKESADLSLSNGLVKEHQWSVGLAVALRMDLK